MVKMPILLAGHTMDPAGIIRPLTMQQQWRVDSLSTASMELDDESPEVTVGDWIQIFAPNGMSGVFYVKTIRQDKITKHNTVALEHTMGLLADMVIFGEKTARDMGGTGTTVPSGTAITYLLNQQTETLWELYQNDFQSVAQGWKFTNSNILADLNDIAEAIQDCQWEFDQSVFPWRLSLKAWPTDATMEMRMNRNIGSMKVTIDRSRMFTRCYPTGKNNKHIDSVNGGVSYLDRNTAIWGVVAQVITDNTIAEPALLKAWAEKQLKKNAEPAVTVSISGYELSKATGEPMDRIVPGRVCRVPLPKYETTITERVMELNWKNVMLDEESVTVTLANEHKTIAGVLNEKAGGGGGGKKSNTEHDCELGENEVKIEEFENSDIWVNRESIWAVSGSYRVITDAQGRHIQLKDGALLEVQRNGIYETVGTAEAIGEVVEDVAEVTGSALWTQRNQITAVSGKFITDGDNLKLVDGAELQVKKSGVYSTVGTVTEINAVKSEIEGSALWTQRDKITGVVGEYDIYTNPITGEKTLIIKSGGGLKIRRNNVEYGLYDSGNLSAGVIVQKINGDSSARASLGFFDENTLTAGFMIEKINGQSSAHINADNVYIGNQKSTTVINGKLSTANLKTAIAEMGDMTVNGNIEGKLVGGVELNGNEIEGGGGRFNYLYLGETDSVNLLDAEVSADGKTLTIHRHSGADITFNKSSTPTLTGSWSGAHLSVSSDPAPASALNYYFGHTLAFDPTNPNIVKLESNWRTSQYSPTGTTFDTGTFNVASRYNAGWNSAYGKVSLPGASTSYAYMQVKTPPATVDGSATTTTFTLSPVLTQTSNSYVNLNNNSGTTVARVSVGALYTIGYNAGYSAGQASMGLSRNGNTITVSESTTKRIVVNYTASRHTAGSISWERGTQSAGPGVLRTGNMVYYGSSTTNRSYTASITGDDYTASSLSYTAYATT